MVCEWLEFLLDIGLRGRFQQTHRFLQERFKLWLAIGDVIAQQPIRETLQGITHRKLSGRCIGHQRQQQVQLSWLLLR